MIQMKQIIQQQQLSIVIVIFLVNFTTHVHSLSDGVNTNMMMAGKNHTIGGNLVGIHPNSTLTADGWLYTVDLLKDDCLNDFTKTSRAIGKGFTKLVRVYNKENDNGLSTNSSGRTFGLRKRIMSMALPLMFKFGVMFTIILTILALVIKTVIIGKMILILNVIGIVLKLVSLKKGHDGGGYHQHAVPIAWVGGHGGWDSHAQQKEIHLHIHNNGGHQTSYEPVSSGHGSYGPPSTGYETISRNDGHHTLVSHLVQQPHQLVQRVVPYNPYSPTTSNEYILV